MDVGPLFSRGLFGQDLPSSLLDHQERSVENAKNDRKNSLTERINRERCKGWNPEQKYADVIPATEAEILFRHGQWSRIRAQVRAALLASHAPALRIERFDNCGGGCVIQYSRTEGRHRILASHCHDRFCWPCGDARGREIRERLLAWIQGQNARKIELTIKHRPSESLSDLIDRLYASFRRLRQRLYWKGRTNGAVAFLEVKRSDDGGWHPHLHVLHVGRIMTHQRLSAEWRKATGGSFVVWLRPIRSAGKDIRYVTKYCTKPMDPSILDDPDSLLECLVALRGRRMWLSTGKHRPCGLEDRPQAAADWRTVGRLDTIIHEAHNGAEWARGILVSLNRSDALTLDLSEMISGRCRPIGEPRDGS